MEIVCHAISFHRWQAEIWEDGVKYSSAIGQRPACAIRDAMNEFCLKHDGMPTKLIKMVVQEWE